MKKSTFLSKARSGSARGRKMHSVNSGKLASMKTKILARKFGETKRERP